MALAPLLLWALQSSTPFDAARKGDVSAVRAYLDAGGDPNVREPKTTIPSLEKNDPGGKPYLGDTLLNLAVEANAKGLVNLLLERRADVDRAGFYGYTPLFKAVARRNVEMVRTLLRAGANPNLRNAYGYPALDLACNYGKVEIVDMLLRRGASIRGEEGYRALVEAMSDSDPKIATLLLRRGVDPNFHPKGRPSPLESVASGYDDTYIRLLKRHGVRGDAAKLAAKAKAEREKSLAETQKIIDEREKRVRAIPGVPMTAEDASVIETAMRSFMAEYAAEKGERKPIALRLTSSTFSMGESDDGQMSGDVGEEKARQIALDVRRDLYRRNKGLTQLTDLHPGPGITMATTKELASAKTRIEFDKPYASVMLPGYSDDRRRALVRFAFGPTPHGAMGTVLLERQGDAWRALWCVMRYYV